MKALVYPGAGWDDSFLHLPIPDYDKYILMDQIPANPYYQPGQRGYSFTHSPERFFNVLREVFGHGGVVVHDEESRIMYFDATKVEYHYSVDVNALIPGTGPLPEHKNYDVFISGYFPTWDRAFFGKTSKVYVFNVWDFSAVAKQKYTAKKNLVDLTGYTQDGDDELEEMDRILRNVMEKEEEDD